MGNQVGKQLLASLSASVRGCVQSAELAIDRAVDLPRGFGYVEYETRADAEKAKLHMDGGQLDGNVITCAPPLPPCHWMLRCLPFS